MTQPAEGMNNSSSGLLARAMHCLVTVDSAERNPRIGRDHLVDEDHPCLDLVDEALALSLIVSPNAATEAEAHIIRKANRFVDVFHAKDRSDGTKKFFPIGRRTFRNIRKDSRRIEIAFTIQALSSQQDARAHLYRLFHLCFQVLQEIRRGQ